MAEADLSESGADTEVEDVTSEAVDTDGANDETQDSDEELVYVIDDEEVTLGQLREWKSDGLREADYTKKTEEVARDREKLNAQFDEVKTQKQEVGTRIEFLGQLEEKAEALMLGAQPDASLLDEDPEGYMREKALYDQRVEKAQEISKEIADLKNEINQENARKLHESLGWADEAKAEADKSLIKQAQKSENISDAEFARIDIPGVMTALVKAAKYDALQRETAGKRVRKVPKTPSPDGSAAPKVKSLAERMYGSK